MISTAIALLLTFWLKVPMSKTMGGFFYVAIIATVWYGNFQAGMLAVILSTLAIDYFFINPIHQLFQFDSVVDLLQLFFFLIIALLINLLFSDLKESKEKVVRLTQQLIQKNSAQLAMALAASQMGIWEWNLITEEINCSSETERLFGLTPGSFDGKYSTFNSYVHPDDRQGLNQAIQEALQIKSTYQHEFRVIWSDGSIHWLESRGHWFEQGVNKTMLITGTLMNIDDRKQAEIARQNLNAELEQRVLERTAALTEVNDRLLTSLLEKQQAQQLLQQSESTLRSFFNSAIIPMGIVEVHHGDILHISDNWAAANFFGRTIEAMQNQFASTLGVPPPTIQLWISYYQKAARNQATVRFEYLHITPKKQYWLSGSVCPITVSPSGYSRFSYMVEDITDRKQAESALRQKYRQDQLLWNITKTIRQSLNLYTILNTTVTEIRQTLETDRTAVYRFNLDWSGNFVVESVGQNWLKLVTSDYQKFWQDTYLRETQGGSFRYNKSFVVHDIYQSELHPCHIRLLEQFQAKSYACFPIFAGENLWGLLAVYQNQIARQWQSWEIELLEQIASQLSIAIHQSELYSQLQIELQERKQATKAIREAERRWRSLLDNVQLIVVGLDLWGNVNYINPFFLKLTGYTQQEVLGKNWLKNFLPPSPQKDINVNFLEVLNHQTYPHERNKIVTKSGEERFIAWNNTALQNYDGTITGTISIGEDITERQKLEEIKNEFIGVVSHELRTPLTAIQISLGLLNTRIYDQKPEKFRRLIEIAILDTNRLVNLVNDILDLERLDSGRAVLEKTICKAVDLMQQAVEGVQPLAVQRQISLIIIPTDAEVWAAPDAMIQTLTNLLSNAIKFSPAHSAIYLSAHNQTDSVQFQVSDRGRGIPEDKLELIFGRFQQVDFSDSREKGGTGLGLSICQSIIKRHGGKIWAESKLGEGTTFFFTIPRTNFD